MTRVIEMPKEGEENKGTSPKIEKVEIVIMFTGYKKPSDQLETMIGASAAQKEESVDLKMLLVREIIKKNHGTIKIEVNQQKPRTAICLVFPIERRRVIYYQTVEP
jgi:hypothetical protein